ncbi:MAG: hypothetical protein HY364_03385 [Candidatus Aenigmarchaeota archaeon]|nr:hypothetical protein [Candidatus Aenigmarchaeota archaeon]
MIPVLMNYRNTGNRKILVSDCEGTLTRKEFMEELGRYATGECLSGRP